MKKPANKSKKSERDNMLPEYDLRGAVRGEFYRPLHKGYTVHVQKSDGTTEVRRYKLIEGAVILQPDVRAYFPDSDAVNKALRSLIELTMQLSAKGSTPAKTNTRSRKTAKP